MSTVISIIAFILIIGFLIFFHEFGHFVMARRNGIAVEEFAIGLGPNIVSWYKKGTRFCLKWIPFGGYCRMLGEEVFGTPAEDEEEALPDDPDRLFSNKSVWARISVISAGPIFNFLLALILSFLLVGLIGATDTEIGAVSEGYPAAEAGIQKGDSIVKLGKTRVHLFSDISLYLTIHEGEEVEVVYERNGVRGSTVLKPRYSEEDGRYLIGIVSSGRKENLSAGNVLKYGWYNFTYNTGAVIKSLGMLIRGRASLNDLSGPVGMAGMVNEIVDDVRDDTKEESGWVTAYWVFINLLSFSILISANLGIMNLLPIPGMDGGRLLFLFWEAVRGKPIEKKKEGIVTLVGFILLLLLMVVVLFNDIRKIFFM